MNGLRQPLSVRRHFVIWEYTQTLLNLMTPIMHLAVFLIHCQEVLRLRITTKTWKHHALAFVRQIPDMRSVLCVIIEGECCNFFLSNN